MEMTQVLYPFTLSILPLLYFKYYTIYISEMLYRIEHLDGSMRDSFLAAPQKSCHSGSAEWMGGLRLAHKTALNLIL